MVELSRGDELQTVDGSVVRVIGDKPLGSGGQGEVYLVEYEGNTCVLKWYTSEQIIRKREAFMNNLVRNKCRSPPSQDFLWPKQVVRFQKGSFGYIMDLIPSNYDSMSNFLRTYKFEKKTAGHGFRRVPVVFETMDAEILSAMHITRAFLQLGRYGLSYQDLNDGGFYMDAKTGEVLICDCDNVVSDGLNLGIRGKPGYMAPEVVTNEGLPNVYTDRHSLAAVLFRLFMHGDPLEGAKVLGCVTLTPANELKYYGYEPVFVFDPNDRSNRPVENVHRNVLKNWPQFPGYLRDMFTQAFTVGLKNPSKRPHPVKWFETMKKLRRDFVECECGYMGFLSNVPHTHTFKCPGCGKEYKILQIGNDEMALVPGKKLYYNDVTYLDPNVTEGDIDFWTVQAEVVENSKRPGLYGFKNVSNITWVASYSNGEVREVEPKHGTTIDYGMKIEFGVRQNNLDNLISLHTKG